MAYRVPTHVAPTDQISFVRPWRGTFIYAQPGSPRANPTHEIYVTAAETDGDNRAELWPSRMLLHFTRSQLSTRDLSDWFQRNSVPFCAFMPDRLPDTTAHGANHGSFLTLSQMLNQNQMVAFAPFDPSRPRNSGILVFPNGSPTDALLVGAVLLNSELVDSVLNGSDTAAHGQPAAASYQPHQPDSGYPYPQQQHYTYSGSSR